MRLGQLTTSITRSLRVSNTRLGATTNGNPETRCATELNLNGYSGQVTYDFSQSHYMAGREDCGKAPDLLHNCATKHCSGQGDVVASTPVPFEEHESGALLHGTKADLAVGDVLMPGRQSNFESGRVMNHVYVTRTLDAAVWAAELAPGDSPGRIFIVEPDGALEDDPNVTDKKFPGNPTRSYRTREPVRIVGEITDWVGHSPEQLHAMRNRLDDLKRQGLAVIYD